MSIYDKSVLYLITSQILSHITGTDTLVPLIWGLCKKLCEKDEIEKAMEQSKSMLESLPGQQLNFKVN